MSRRALEVVEGERDTLRAQVASLTEDIVRLARHESGLPERRPRERTKREPDEMTPSVRKLLEGFNSPAIASMYELEMREQRRRGWTWEQIDGYVRSKLGLGPDNEVTHGDN